MLTEAIPVSTTDPLIQGSTEHITMLFAPRCVRHFSHNGLNQPIGGVETIVKAHRVEAVPEVPQVRKQPDRTGRPATGLRFDEITHILIQRLLRIAQVVALPKPGQVRGRGRPKPAFMEEVR